MYLTAVTYYCILLLNFLLYTFLGFSSGFGGGAVRIGGSVFTVVGGIGVGFGFGFGFGFVEFLLQSPTMKYFPSSALLFLGIIFLRFMKRYLKSLCFPPRMK